MKAQRLMLLSQLHGVTITRADLALDDGLKLSPQLFDAAEFLEHEKVEVYCLESGARLSCSVKRHTSAGELEVGGAAAQLLKPGAKVVMSTWTWLKEKQALKHEPRLLHVDDDNALQID
ncbi:MAG: aspartate 1-decarboxylase [Archangium sp.]